jgi:hypothetical protein
MRIGLEIVMPFPLDPLSALALLLALVSRSELPPAPLRNFPSGPAPNPWVPWLKSDGAQSRPPLSSPP